MTAHKFDNFSHYFYNWQKNVISFGLKRNLANKELDNYVKSFRNIDFEIYKSLFAAKEFYAKKRRYYNKKIKKLKQNEIDFKKLLEYVYNERKSSSEPKEKDEISTSIKRIKEFLEDIDNKFYNLNEKIEEANLKIDEENNIIEEIKNLDRDKQISLRHLKTLEGDLVKEMQSNTYFKNIRTIEILEVNLKEIHRNLNKWSIRKVKIHKQMLNLYRKAKEFENIKRQIEKELLGIKQTADKNIQLFYELKDRSEKKAFQEQLKSFKDKVKAKELSKLKTRYLIKKKRTLKKYTKKKLSIALQKQKSGKKLDFYELKLIMDHSRRRE